MISILILLATLLCGFFIGAWVIALAARAVGSSRGRLRVGILAALLTTALNIIFLFIKSLFPATPMENQVVLAVVSLAELCGIFLILKYSFRLNAWRATAPFGALVACGALNVVFVIAVLKPYLVETFAMSSAHMSPTIKSHDYFCVNKLSHPKRYDLVVYRQEASGVKGIWCSRLVGLPGDRLKFDRGNLIVNGQLAHLPAMMRGRCYAAGAPVPGNSARYIDGQTITLRSNEVFMIGDDPEISNDSRFTGPSKISSIIGVADLIYWPPRRIRVLH